MTTGSAQTWHNYIISLMYWQQIYYNRSDDLLKEIDAKFGETDKRTMQFLKVRTMQQGDNSADEHIQDFEKATLEAGYDGYPLVVEFKWSLHPILRKRLTELWPMPMTIHEWYQEAITVDRHWRVAWDKEAFYNKKTKVPRGKPPRDKDKEWRCSKVYNRHSSETQHCHNCCSIWTLEWWQK